MQTKPSYTWIKLKTVERFYHRKLKQKRSRMKCPSIFPIKNLKPRRFCICVYMHMCVYICVCVCIHMFHVSTHGDQKLASCVFFSWSLPYFWDKLSHWTWSSLTQQDQQGSNFKIRLHPRSRIRTGSRTATPGFLQEHWGSCSKHRISPAPRHTFKWEAFGRYTQTCVALYIAYSCLFYSAQEEKFTVQCKGKFFYSGAFNNWS